MTTLTNQILKTDLIEALLSNFDFITRYHLAISDKEVVACGPPSLSMSGTGLMHECAADGLQHQTRCTRYEARTFGRGCRHRRFDEFCTWVDDSINKA